MSLTFFYAPQSSASPTHWILEELKVPYEKVRVDLKSDEQKKEKLLALNPNGKVPVLVHEGTPIFESVAIAIYLGETFGVAKGLWPAPGRERGQAVQWLVWCNVTLGEAVSRLGRNTQYAPPDHRNEKAAELARQDVGQLLGILDRALDGKTYLVGKDFSLVDAHLVSWMTYVTMFGFDLAKHPNVAAWTDRCMKRPAASVE